MAEDRELLYLYGIFLQDEPLKAGLESNPVTGVVAHEPLFVVSGGGLAAAVSRVPAQDFEEEPLNELLGDLPRLAPFVVRHEEVMQHLLMSASGLIPAAFGRVFRSREGVTAMLQAQGEQLRETLTRVRGHQEWTLKVTRDAAVLWHAAGESPRLVELAQAEAAAAPGKAYLLRRQRERLRGVEAAGLMASALQAVLARVREVASQVEVEELPSHTPGEVDLALKAALLVARSATSRLDRVVEEANRDLLHIGLVVEVSGPWAPYSFVATARAAAQGLMGGVEE